MGLSFSVARFVRYDVRGFQRFVAVRNWVFPFLLWWTLCSSGFLPLGRTVGFFGCEVFSSSSVVLLVGGPLFRWDGCSVFPSGAVVFGLLTSGWGTRFSATKPRTQSVVCIADLWVLVFVFFFPHIGILVPGSVCGVCKSDGFPVFWIVAFYFDGNVIRG
jgi:hypothetical protein